MVGEAAGNVSGKGMSQSSISPGEISDRGSFLCKINNMLHSGLRKPRFLDLFWTQNSL